MAERSSLSAPACPAGAWEGLWCRRGPGPLLALGVLGWLSLVPWLSLVLHEHNPVGSLQMQHAHHRLRAMGCLEQRPRDLLCLIPWSQVASG